MITHSFTQLCEKPSALSLQFKSSTTLRLHTLMSNVETLFMLYFMFLYVR